MSANNYMLIHKVGSKYYAWNNLEAEELGGDPPLKTSEADFSDESLEKVIAWANENDFTEYGYQINSLSKPKDGFVEAIEIDEDTPMSDELRKQLWETLYPDFPEGKGLAEYETRIYKVMQLISAHDTAIRIEELEDIRKVSPDMYVGDGTPQIYWAINIRLASLRGKGEAE